MSDFAAEVLRERALLAAVDPDGEADAIVPLTPVRARQVLLEEQPRPIAASAPGPRSDGRDLLTRLGADPDRGHGLLHCPAHEDHHPSLSWRLADDGRPLLRCFAGCTFRAIVEAVR